MEMTIKRESNIELLRIVLMFLIVMHHSLLYSTNVPWGGCVDGKHIFAQLWSMWGKMAINSYLLITGYFMCERQVSYQKFFRLLFQVKFWDVSIFVICLMIGCEKAGIYDIFNVIFKNCRQINLAFTGSFLFLYLLIPYINILIKGLDKRGHVTLIVILLGVFTGIGTFLCVPGVFCLPFWYITVYLIGSALRKYPCDWMRRNKICVPILVVTVFLSVVSLLGVDYVAFVSGHTFGRYAPWYMIHDSNKPLALLVGIMMFLVFKNFSIAYSKAINLMGSATFGVLLIHDSLPCVRNFIWCRLFHLDEYFESLPLIQFAGLCLVSTLMVYLVSSLFEIMRIRFIERPIFHR